MKVNQLEPSVYTLGDEVLSSQTESLRAMPIFSLESIGLKVMRIEPAALNGDSSDEVVARIYAW